MWGDTKLLAAEVERLRAQLAIHAEALKAQYEMLRMISETLPALRPVVVVVGEPERETTSRLGDYNAN